ncbi:MAG: GGDEF domain-containing protein [Sphaerochaetaceae bacterium]
MPSVIFIQNLYQLIFLFVMFYAWVLAKSRVPGIGFWTMNLLLNTIGLCFQMFFVKTPLPIFRITSNLFFFSGGIIFYYGLASYASCTILKKTSYALLLLMLFSSIMELVLPLPLEIFIITNAFVFLATIALYCTVFLKRLSSWFGWAMKLFFFLYILIAATQIFRIYQTTKELVKGIPTITGFELPGYTATSVINRLMLFCVNFIILLLVYKKLLHDLEIVIENQKTLSIYLKNLAEHDELTGLYNRRTIEQLISLYIPQKKSQKMAVLFMLDIDHFKDLNDTYGHQCGDIVLQNTAQGISSLLEKRDLLGRWGGDEFLLLVERKRKAEIADLLQSMKLMTREICQQYPGTHGYSLSGGFTLLTVDDTLENALYRADTLLYQAKDAGRNRIIGDLYGDGV